MNKKIKRLVHTKLHRKNYFQLQHRQRRFRTCQAARILYGKTSLSQNSSVFRGLWEEGMLQTGKHGVGVAIFFCVVHTFTQKEKDPRFETRRRHKCLLGFTTKSIWYKNQPNRICGATHPGNPFGNKGAAKSSFLNAAIKWKMTLFFWYIFSV